MVSVYLKYQESDENGIRKESISFDDSELNELQKQLFSGAKEHFEIIFNEFDRLMKMNKILPEDYKLFTESGFSEETKIDPFIMPIFNSVEAVYSAIEHLCSERFAEFVDRYGQACSYIMMYHVLKKTDTDILPKHEIALKKRNARRSAAAKISYDKDNKQKEKRFVRECWNEWKNEPTRYKSKAAFAKDMLSKVEKLESQKKIEDWCREWEKEQQQA